LYISRSLVEIKKVRWSTPLNQVLKAHALEAGTQRFVDAAKISNVCGFSNFTTYCR